MGEKEAIKEKLERLRQSLFTKALSDGKISSEERMILNSVNYDIDNLLESLDLNDIAVNAFRDILKTRKLNVDASKLYSFLMTENWDGVWELLTNVGGVDE